MKAPSKRNARARLIAANPVPDGVVREIVSESWSSELLDRVLQEPVAPGRPVSGLRMSSLRRNARRPVARLALVGAAVLTATLVAAPALGLPKRLMTLFSNGEPAPARTELAFSTLDRGAPPGLQTHVIPGTARKAFDVTLPQGDQATLWVAPTATGGFCEMLELVDDRGLPRGRSGPGCDDRADATGYGVTMPGPISRQGIERGPVVVSGYAGVRGATTVIIAFEDGAETQLSLTWISEPIGAGFFVYGVPPAHWKPGRLPRQLRYLNAQGDTIGEQHGLRFGPLISGTPNS